MTRMRSALALMVFLVAGMLSVGLAQTKNAYIKAAEEAEAANDYYSAMTYYQNVLEFDADDLTYVYKTAENARKIKAYKKAEEYYSRVIDSTGNADFPLATYQLARVQQKLGKYDQAQSNFQVFLTEYDGEDEEIKAQAETQMAAADWAEGYIETVWEEYEMTHLGGDVNTEYPEFSGIAEGDSLYFTSLRFENDKDSYVPTRPFSGILVSEEGSGSQRLGEDINIENRHTAHTAFNHDGSRLYFTICEYLKADSIRCDLYYRDKSGELFGEAMALTSVNMAGYTTTQPNIAYDAASGTETLYFASDRPGGAGGLDIYSAPILADSVGDISNLSDVNTPGDEITPFYHSPTKTLYFSSNGRKTLGGLDVFKVSMREGGSNVIQHLGYPLNDSYDDISFTLNEKGDVAYFASNREGSQYRDATIEACCFDIYKVDILPFANLIAQAFDAETSDSLKGTLFTLHNLTTGESWTASAEDLASSKFPLARDMDYMLIGSKDGYVPDTVTFNTVDIKSLDDIIKKLYLVTDVLHLDVFTFDARTREALRAATVTLYDLDDENSQPIVLENLQSNDFHFVLERGKRYRVTATRKGYTSATVVVDTDDHWDKSRLRQDLYLDLGDLGDFLPLIVYFDNDHPNPRTRLKETTISYTETFPPYYGKKQEFIDNFSSPLSGEERSTAENQLASFFDTEVKKGNDDLLLFLEVLEAHLEEGDQVSIYLKGYASPRSSRSYNQALGERRVSSVRNNFERYAGGRLQAYLDSGQLVIDQKSFGETTAPSGISSSISDRRGSVYSYEASKERRVEVVQIDIN